MTIEWSNQGPLSRYQQRAFLLSEIRRFFAARGVLEVETPVLSAAGNTDVQIDMFSTQGLTDQLQPAFLRTSPEFFHKRLLASGSGDIFELAKVFRRGERTPLHNPEFTLLEWYRLGFDLSDLMTEVQALMQRLNQRFNDREITVRSLSYQSLFEQSVHIDPFAVSLTQLQALCSEHGYIGSKLSRTAALDFLFAVVIQPLLAAEEGVMIYHFPIEMAALAAAHPEQPKCCLRFEFLWRGVELANGYQELTDADEQLARFQQDNQQRKTSGRTELPIDQRLIAALQSGLPACSGVAVGVERLLMCLLGLDNINEVLGFPAENA